MGPPQDKTALRSPFSRARKRLRELERVIKARHGTVPCTDDADLYLLPVARCYRKIMADNGKPVSVDGVMNRFGLWCETWAPHLTSEAADIVSQALAEPAKIDRDDELGASLRLTYAERLRLKITTIGSYDVDRKSRKELAKARRRERNRRRAAKKRRASGARPRGESWSRTKPWEAEGISRRTWERRRKKAETAQAAHDANSSPHHHKDGVDANSSPHPLKSMGDEFATGDIRGAASGELSKRRAPQARRRQSSLAPL
jgi:hypothetical protein